MLFVKGQGLSGLLLFLHTPPLRSDALLSPLFPSVGRVSSHTGIVSTEPRSSPGHVCPDDTQEANSIWEWLPALSVLLQSVPAVTSKVCFVTSSDLYSSAIQTLYRKILGRTDVPRRREAGHGRGTSCSWFSTRCHLKVVPVLAAVDKPHLSCMTWLLHAFLGRQTTLPDSEAEAKAMVLKEQICCEIIITTIVVIVVVLFKCTSVGTGKFGSTVKGTCCSCR